MSDPRWEDVSFWALAEVERARDDLEHAAPEAVPALQGRLGALRALLRLPADPRRDPAMLVGDDNQYLT